MWHVKQKEIIAFLTKNHERWVTAGQLSDYCGCTTRTIRNHIAKMNQEVENLIQASNQGYQINPTIQLSALSNENEERKSRIFLELLKGSAEGVDIFDLSERLFISESTLKSDIQQLKLEITDKAIQIIIEQNRIKLSGPERSKRRYMISLLYNESDLQEQLKQTIQEMIGYISLEQLQQTILAVLRKENIRINQYSLNNIVLHYAISIERIRQGHIIKRNKEYVNLVERKEYQLAEEIAEMLAGDYEIHFSQAELEQLSLLFIGMQNEELANKEDEKLAEFVDQRIIETLHSVLAKVEKTYLIKLDDSEFFNKLAIHVQSLYYRSHYETFTRNSSLLDLKTGYPLTYDLSVYISSLLQDELDIWFNDDEISFIALHIGSFLETRKQHQDTITALLVVNDYHDLKEQLEKKINQDFGTAIRLTIGERERMNRELYDILLTTDRQLASQYEGAVFIHPFLTEKDSKRIEKRLSALKAKKEKERMYRYIDQFISRELYFNQIDPSELTPQEIREQINQRMVDYHYVNQGFSQKVEKREQMSPTSFPSGIAVPHSVEVDALKSGVAIMTLQDTIVWSTYAIKLVGMVAINKEEAAEFNEFFERFIEIVSEPINTRQLSLTEDYDEFISKLKLMVAADE
ncbi:BglG family transcription antiterminator [Enterococcus sp. BWR-S5]|uniref:BglG family transcription antiterminator n=1 Tax=Enterococcus sp. BWR-S5 TaxID=2787714 RepID=UPI001924B698|nr:BglG family transcription antiterminator [Enterococcus sp. BWR-S5]MBL1223984.1 BglG family transcription antiterminator [Enterococcus sp. BWR-S5]